MSFLTRLAAVFGGRKVSYHKITDVRAAFGGGSFELTVAGVGRTSSKEPIMDPTRAGAMALIFASGASCYWDDDAKVFVTDPTDALAEPGNSDMPTKGLVGSWDIRIPLRNPEPIKFYVNLVPPPKPDTSGVAAPRRHEMIVDDAHILAVLGILMSKYSVFTGSHLKNSEVV